MNLQVIHPRKDNSFCVESSNNDYGMMLELFLTFLNQLLDSCYGIGKIIATLMRLLCR